MPHRLSACDPTPMAVCTHPPSFPAADLLYGTAKAGRYQFDKVLNVSSTTVDGVVSGGNSVWECVA